MTLRSRCTSPFRLKLRCRGGCLGGCGADGGDRVRPACAFRGWAAGALESWRRVALSAAVAGCGWRTTAAGTGVGSSTSVFKKGVGVLYISCLLDALPSILASPRFSSSTSTTSHHGLVGAADPFCVLSDSPQPLIAQVLFSILIDVLALFAGYTARGTRFSC